MKTKDNYNYITNINHINKLFFLLFLSFGRIAIDFEGPFDLWPQTYCFIISQFDMEIPWKRGGPILLFYLQKIPMNIGILKVYRGDTVWGHQ